jgi:negative regulator of sigma-B (phosphoserine phosphatase)
MDPRVAIDGWPDALDRGVAGAPMHGESRSGDLAVFAPTERGGMACLIDGLGHGDAAADAAEAAGAMVRDHADAPAQELLDLCHEALRGTRGAVMTLAWFDLERAELAWTGVGNVDARLVRPGPDPNHAVALVFAGTVGYQVPRVRPSVQPVMPGDTLVMVTDGIDAGFAAALRGGGNAQALAERIFGEHGKGTDDALAVVVTLRL